MHGAIPLLPNTSLWHGAWLSTGTTLLLPFTPPCQTERERERERALHHIFCVSDEICKKIKVSVCPYFISKIHDKTIM
jgi:hypothetical protein